VSPWASLRLDASDFLKIFEDRIRKQKLLPAIRETIKRSEVELDDGRKISIVLLSGGSSNIRWIKPLIEGDLVHELKQADILELNENFQEIVSKGLAVDCARRFTPEERGTSVSLL
jgi:molecular chaperone DnaK (HSP70)